jgi:regulator of RNase E activity RraA
MIIADENGVTVVPHEDLESVLKLAKEQAEREELTRKAIAAGKTVDELIKEFGRI